MTESSDTVCRQRSATQEGFLLALLCLGAFLGNWCPIHVVLNVEILTGSIFVMLAIGRFGMGGAALAGAIAATATIFTWGHPFSAIVLFLEALAVALCKRRRWGNLVLADTVFWIVAGMPLIFLFYGGVLRSPPHITLLIALKESVNGLLNALLATAILYGQLLMRNRTPFPQNAIPLREIIFTALVAITILPSIGELFHEMIENVDDAEAEMNSQVTIVATNADRLLGAAAASSMQGVIALAQLVRVPEHQSRSQLQHEVETLKLGIPSLLLMAAFDRNGTCMARAPAAVPSTDPLVTGCTASAAELTQLQRTLQPLVGGTARVGGAASGAVVPVFAPIVINGSYRGYCAGAVNLDVFSMRLGTLLNQPRTEISVVDRRGSVVVSTGKRFRPRERFVWPESNGARYARQGGYHLQDQTPGSARIMARGAEKVMVREIPASARTPWHIVVERPLAPLVTEVAEKINDQLLLLWGTTLLILPVSRVLSRLLSNSLGRLEQTAAAIPARLGQGISDWPGSRIREVQSLSTHIQVVADALTATFREVTALNQTLEQRIEERTSELRASSERLQNLSLQVPGAFFQFQLFPDGRSTFPYVSRAIEELYEVTPEELARDGSRLLKLIHPDDLPGYLASVEESRHSGRPWQHEFRVVLPAQGVRWRLGSARPQQQDDGSILWHGFITDVSDRKFIEQELAESELRYRNIIESSPNLIVIQEKGKIVFVNPAAVRKLGARSADDLLGTPLLARLHPQDREISRQRVEKVQREQISVPPRELRLLRLDGDVTIVEAVMMPIQQQGRPAVLSIAVDVTARKRAEELLYQQTTLLEEEVHERQRAEQALAQKQMQLAVLNCSLEKRVAEELAKSREKDQILISQSRMAAMGEMIGNIAHQWRQPLNALDLLIANMADAYHFGEMDEAYLEKATAEGNRLIQKMSSTINDFRNFFRPDREVVAFSAAQQIREAISLVESSFGNDQIRIQVQGVPDLRLAGFPNQFSQVLLNLLTNAKEAIKGRGEGAGDIVISLQMDGGKGCITVRDSGGGIPDAVLPRIFEPYFSTKQGGTGIGLYMSKMIIERNMNGNLRARNVAGGAEFAVFAPLAGESANGSNA
ncbi:PAS domain S-box protein [Geomesophilobacter sediminis]|uniref:histidine kinase n=1 Tax=Geomesophilobacter sediminis TaxID=2798584 RepID=A0A8J7M371_9BACT|nr:PAS domain S-box protein [Geomesophilobacter sediminis]MBJ6727909.1 PAS domain S-box protein [Geomesophilobacter sediminis]